MDIYSPPGMPNFAVHRAHAVRRFARIACPPFAADHNAGHVRCGRIAQWTVSPNSTVDGEVLRRPLISPDRARTGSSYLPKHEEATALPAAERSSREHTSAAHPTQGGGPGPRLARAGPRQPRRLRRRCMWIPRSTRSRRGHGPCERLQGSRPLEGRANREATLQIADILKEERANELSYCKPRPLHSLQYGMNSGLISKKGTDNEQHEELSN